MKSTAKNVIKLSFEYHPMSEAHTCIAEQNLELLPLSWYIFLGTQFSSVKSITVTNIRKTFQQFATPIQAMQAITVGSWKQITTRSF